MASARSQLMDRLEPMITEVRRRRQPVEEKWLLNHACWRGVRTRFYFNSEHYQHYWPAARNAVEHSTTRIRQMLVPGNNAFEVYPGDVFDIASGQSADSISAFMEYLLFKRIHIKKLVGQLARCFYLYDRAITKSSVELDTWSEDSEGKIEHKDIWASLRAVDPFNWYMFPETGTDPDKAQLLFEDAMCSWSDYLDAQEAAPDLIDAINPKDLDKPAWPTHHTRRLSLTPVASPADLRSQGMREDKTEAREVGEFVVLTEGYMKVDQKWMLFWIVWNLRHGPKIVRLQDLVGPRQPYRLAVARDVPGETHSSGRMDDLEPLNVLLNDQVNRMEEAATIAALPPVIVDPNRVTRADSLVWRPRAKWMTEPDGVRILPVPDTSRGMQAAMAYTMNLINSVFSSGGLSSGQPPRGSPRAGFAFSTLMNMSMADMKDDADIIEEELLTPALQDLYTLTVLFTPREQVLKIPGTANYAPQTLSTYDLYGGWNFKWVGQLGTQDLQMRGQKIQEFLQALSPMYQGLTAQGYQIDLGQLVKIIWRDVLNERGIDRIITKAPPAPPPVPPGASSPGGPGQPPPQVLAAIQALGGAAGGQLAPTPENAQRQVSRRMSGAMGG